MALYMGSPNLMGFGGQPKGPRPIGPEPFRPRQTPQSPEQPPGNILQPEAVRTTGPSQGYDPSYLQNLATAIGGLFAGPRSGGNTVNINPLGNLGEISPPSGIGGNAPTLGEPLTWLQQAINGGGFAYNPSKAAPTPVNGSPQVIARQPRNPILPGRNQ